MLVGDPDVARVIDAVVFAAGTGAIGDGKVWSTAVDVVVRFRPASVGPKRFECDRADPRPLLAPASMGCRPRVTVDDLAGPQAREPHPAASSAPGTADGQE